MAAKKEPPASPPHHRPDGLLICLCHISWNTTQVWLLSLTTSTKMNTTSTWYLRSVCIESRTKGHMETLWTITMNLDQEQKWKMRWYTETESLQGLTPLVCQATTALLLLLTHFWTTLTCRATQRPMRCGAMGLVPYLSFALQWRGAGPLASLATVSPGLGASAAWWSRWGCCFPGWSLPLHASSPSPARRSAASGRTLKGLTTWRSGIRRHSSQTGDAHW